MDKRTPLYSRHQELGGKIVSFAGWELPVQYTGVIPEHTATRTKAGLFDVSHMGEVFVTGPEATESLQYLTCNDVTKLTDGKAQYSAILNEKGGVVDDIIIYRYAADNYLVCVNASNADKDFEWLKSHNKHNATYTNKSAEYGQVALQGPNAVKIVESIPELKSAANLEYFSFADIKLGQDTIICARTGYTGEDGFEFFVPAKSTVSFWNLLLEAGSNFGLVPCGLGARDSLRLEACYPLHGHELGEDISALESGLAWIVKFSKGDFIGKSALEVQKNSGIPRILVGFEVLDSGIARENLEIFSSDGKKIGITTSGTKTPTIQKSIGMALVNKEYSAVGTEIFIEVRGKRLKTLVAKKPFYKKGDN
jgi:aminomethyltransferase